MNLPTFDLMGRVAIVTGASKGMGRAIAAILAQAGARVVVSSRTQADCDKVAADISPEKGRAIGIAADMSNVASINALISATQAKLGHVDIVVANAAGEVPIGPSGQARSRRSRPDHGHQRPAITSCWPTSSCPKWPRANTARLSSCRASSARAARLPRRPLRHHQAAVNQLVRNLARRVGDRTRSASTPLRRPPSAPTSPAFCGKHRKRWPRRLQKSRWADRRGRRCRRHGPPAGFASRLIYQRPGHRRRWRRQRLVSGISKALKDF